MKRDLAAFAGETFDLLVLGGGITGAGVALDAALRGLRVALIDQGDFASGTSSVSSKLVHGGLRYLEHGDIPLVAEALHERGRLLRNAPHLVWPLRFIIPYYPGARVPPWKYRIGLTLYDLLAGRLNIRRSYPVRRPRLLGEFAGLRSEGLAGGAAYYDAQMDDARLCIEVLRSAAKEGACVANYVEAVAFEKTGGAITGVRAVDRQQGGELHIRARQVVNACGPWVDRVCQLAGEEAGPLLQPTKGVHIVTADRGLQSAFLLLHPADGRVFFVIPWLGKTLVGTTDTFTEEGPDALVVTAAEVAYLLEGHNHFFAPPLAVADVMGSFAGLRPLVRARPGQPSALSREFRLLTSPSGLISVAGGKYTTFRRMAEVVTDAVCVRLGRRRACRTQNYRLDGAPSLPTEGFVTKVTAELERRHGLAPESACHLARRYGARAADVADYIRADPDLARPLLPGEPDLKAEWPYQRDHEMALRPADHLLRRTRLGLFHPHLLASPPASQM